jgi:hypothetical protein
MTHAWTHAWCKSPARDEAVRAAEDGRDRPLPTLKECIVAPFADAAERPVPVSKTGEGQSGMRTERITLEVKHGEPFGVSHWSWVTILRLQSGESVRVVSDEEPGRDMGNGVFVASVSEVHAMYGETVNLLTAERDAAIRERDELRKSWLRSEESGTRLLAERNAALDAADALRKRVAHLEDANRALQDAADAACDLLDESKARVAELEAASGGGEQEPVAFQVELFKGCTLTYRDRQVAYDKADAEGGGTVVPLYRSPPQPRGWLTGEEREAITLAAAQAPESDFVTNEEGRHLRTVLTALLARSTPPEVVRVPLWRSKNSQHQPFMEELMARRDAEWIAALAAAGVAVKEVP